MKRARCFLFTLLIALSASSFRAQGPAARKRILLDEAHHNLFAAAAGGYRPFVELVTDDGFAVATNSLPLSPQQLTTADVLVITNPNGADAAAPVEQRAQPAFTAIELDALQRWVAAGGALLLVTDHYPTGVSARSLAERFGVQLSGGWTDDPSNRRSLQGYGAIFGYLVFSRANGLLGDHPITRGRDGLERVRAVTTTTGGSLLGPPESTPVLRLSPTAVDWLPSGVRRSPDVPAARAEPRDFNPCPACVTQSAAGRNQGAAFEFGQGRVVVIGEMGALVDYSVQGTDNRQFTLNIMRWLVHEL